MSIMQDLERLLREIAEQHCQGRLVSVLEGGYGLEGLAASVEAHLRVLMEHKQQPAQQSK